MKINNQKQQLDIHNSPLFEPIIPKDEEETVGGVPQKLDPVPVVPSNIKDKLEALEKLRAKVKPPELKF